jgi:hypothetical protein
MGGFGNVIGVRSRVGRANGVRKRENETSARARGSDRSSEQAGSATSWQQSGIN